MIPRRGKLSLFALVGVVVVEPEEPEEVPDVVPVVVPPLEPDVVPVVVPPLEPEVVPVVVLPLEPEVVPVVVPLLELVADPLPVPPEVLAADVPVAVPVALEVVPVSAAVVGADESDPESPPPQPANAIDTLPNSAGQITRLDPNPRLAFLMRSPKKDFIAGRGGTKSFSGSCTRGHGNALGCRTILTRQC